MAVVLGEEEELFEGGEVEEKRGVGGEVGLVGHAFFRPFCAFFYSS